MEALIREVSDFLESKYNCRVSKNWIVACLKWIESEYGHLSADNLKNKLWDQILLQDFTELNLHCLPANLHIKQKLTYLNGNFLLQVTSYHDISQSSYSQLQKLERENLENLAVDTACEEQSFGPKPKRLLLLDLTDGSSSIRALEYSPIQCLPSKLPLGCKILISGCQMECRLGIIFLRSENVKYLGGNVETISNRNNELNNLRNKLLITQKKISHGTQGNGCENRTSRNFKNGTQTPTKENERSKMNEKSDVQSNNWLDDDFDNALLSVADNFSNNISNENKPTKTSGSNFIMTDLKFKDKDMEYDDFAIELKYLTGFEDQNGLLTEFTVKAFISEFVKLPELSSSGRTKNCIVKINDGSCIRSVELQPLVLKDIVQKHENKKEKEFDPGDVTAIENALFKTYGLMTLQKKENSNNLLCIKYS